MPHMQKASTSNPGNLVAVVGGSARPGIVANQVPICNNNQVNANKGNKSKRKRNRGSKNRVYKPPIQGTVQPIENMQRNSGSRIDILPDRPTPIRNHNNVQQKPNVNKPIPSQTSPVNQQKSRIRQENIPENFRFIALPRYVHMNVGTTIYLDTFSKKTYEPGSTDFDRELLIRHDVWHQFVVHHNGKFKKKDILASLFALVRMQELFPIGYREYLLHDVFLLTSYDRAGIEVLFNKNLKLRIQDTEVCISVQLGAGQLQMGQVHPKAQIILVCQELLENATLHGNDHCMNMENFEKHQALMEISISFANNFHLMTVIKALIEQPIHSIQPIKGIKFANCGIEKIDSFRFLSNMSKLEYIDLRNNQLESVFDLKHLEKLNLTRLDVAGNPFAGKEELTHLQERVKKLLPTVKYLDGVELLIRPKLEPGLSNGEDLDFDIMLDGDPIKVNDDLNAIQATFKQRYKGSNYWHKVTVR